MRQKIFWLDLAICSLWLFIALANCSWWSLPAHFFYGCHSRDENYSLLLPLPQGETKLDIIDCLLGSIRLAVCCGASYDHDG